MKKAKINSITELFFWAALEFMKEKLFHEAADKIVTVSRAFEFEKSLHESLAEAIDELRYKDFDQFISELIERIQIAKKAAVYFSKDEQVDALNNFSSFLSDILQKKVETFLEGENNDEAIKCLRKLIKLDPDNSTMYSYLASVYFKNMEIDKAIEAAKTALTKEKNKDLIALRQYYLLVIYLTSTRYSEALIIAEELEKKQPNNVTFLFDVAKTYHFNKLFIKERKVIKRIITVIDLESSSLEFLNQIAEAYHENDQALLFSREKFIKGTEDYSHEEKFFKKILLNDMQNTRVMTNLSKIYFFSNRISEAINILEKVKTFLPNDPIALTNLASIYFFDGNYNKSIQLFLKSDLIKPNQIINLNNLACAYAKLGDFVNATRFIKLALDLAPDNTSIIENYENIVNRNVAALIPLGLQ